MIKPEAREGLQHLLEVYHDLVDKVEDREKPVLPLIDYMIRGMRAWHGRIEV